MDRLFLASYSLDYNKFLVDEIATKNATRTNDGYARTAKATTYYEQDNDVSHACHTRFLCYHVQRSICNILLRQQLYDDDHFAFIQPYSKEYG